MLRASSVLSKAPFQAAAVGAGGLWEFIEVAEPFPWGRLHAPDNNHPR